MYRPKTCSRLPVLFSLIAASAMLKRQEPQVTMDTSGTGHIMITFDFVSGQQVAVQLGKSNILSELTVTMRIGREPTTGAIKDLEGADFDTAPITRDLEDYGLVTYETVPYAGILLVEANITLAQISQTSPFFGAILEKLVNTDVVRDGTTNRYGLIAADIDLVASIRSTSRCADATKLVVEAA